MLDKEILISNVGIQFTICVICFRIKKKTLKNILYCHHFHYKVLENLFAYRYDNQPEIKLNSFFGHYLYQIEEYSLSIPTGIFLRKKDNWEGNWISHFICHDLKICKSLDPLQSTFIAKSVLHYLISKQKHLIIWFLNNSFNNRIDDVLFLNSVWKDETPKVYI